LRFAGAGVSIRAPLVSRGEPALVEECPLEYRFNPRPARLAGRTEYLESPHGALEVSIRAPLVSRGEQPH